MGQKGCPIGIRIPVTKKWRSIWYAKKNEFGDFLIEDQRIRAFLLKKPICVGVSTIEIRRMSEKIEITLFTARPGLVIGKKGVGIDTLREELRKFTGKEIWVEVAEVKRPDIEAKLVAESIAKQLERRVAYRRAVKRSISLAMDAKALGIKVQVSGRIGGAEIARSEWYKEGRIPLHTLRANIDYGTATARTTYGAIGIKVWVNRGEDFGTRVRKSRG